MQTKDANNPPEAKEERKAVDFTGPVDSVYLDSPGYVELDVGTGDICILCIMLGSDAHAEAGCRCRLCICQLCFSFTTPQADEMYARDVRQRAILVCRRGGGDHLGAVE